MVETKISQIIESAVEELGFSLVRVLYSGGQAGRNQLQIMAEPREDREMTVEDCQMISRHVSALLDVEDPISGAYLLEVSSPGIDRPLTCLADYDRFSGELAKLTLRLMQDGRRRFNGRLGGVSDAEDYQKGIKDRTAMTREWNLFLEKYPLILSPYLMQPVGKWDSDTKNVEELRKFLNSGIYSLSISWLSLPAGVVPIGMVDGLPAGVQIIGKRFREDLILNAMQVIEDHTGILTKELWARENIV